MKNNESHNESHEEFWDLADEYRVNILSLSQIVSAPIKLLLEWRDNGTTPQSALDDLVKFLEGTVEYE